MNYCTICGAEISGNDEMCDVCCGGLPTIEEAVRIVENSGKTVSGITFISMAFPSQKIANALFRLVDAADKWDDAEPTEGCPECEHENRICVDCAEANWEPVDNGIRELRRLRKELAAWEASKNSGRNTAK